MTSTEWFPCLPSQQSPAEPPETNGKRGRPPKGAAAMTDVERARAYRELKKKSKALLS